MSEHDGGGGGVAGRDAGDELGQAEGDVGWLRGESCVGARLDDPAVEIEIAVEYCAFAGCERAGRAAGEGGWGG